MNKLTGEQIIKALDHCKRPTGKHDCDHCPYVGSRGSCTTVLLNDTIDLINRQKAEIERLKKAIKVQDIMIEQQDYKLKSAKSEAIKEFAERLKEEFPMGESPFRNLPLDMVIDNLVKEMTEKGGVSDA